MGLDDRLAIQPGQETVKIRENAAMADTPDTTWVKVYDGEGHDAKLIFEETAREWQNYMTARGWCPPAE